GRSGRATPGYRPGAAPPGRRGTDGRSGYGRRSTNTVPARFGPTDNSPPLQARWRPRPSKKDAATRMSHRRQSGNVAGWTVRMRQPGPVNRIETVQHDRNLLDRHRPWDRPRVAVTGPARSNRPAA